MATPEQVQLVLNHLEKSHPKGFYKALNEQSAGIGAVLHFLHDSPNSVTAGDISEYMHVSTARVAALLKKMVEQALVTKDSNANDARVTIVHISSKGEEKFRQIHDEIYDLVNKVIDEIGMDRIMDYITLSDEIKSVLSPPERRSI